MPIHPTEVFHDFKTYPFFASFQEPLLLQISTLATLMEFEPGFEVLTQGQTNDCLYFLKMGTVDIIVDRENVASLNKNGEVFGEMSVLSGRPVSATLKCRTLSQFYVLNPNDFSHALPKDRDRFLFLLYKIYSAVVADRLVLTNEKAKKFEIANRDLADAHLQLEQINRNLENLVEDRTRELRQKASELETSRASLEQQNAALVAGFRKVTDLSEIKDRTLERIRVLSQDHVIPLKKTIENSINAKEGSAELLRPVFTGLTDLLDFVKPLTDLYQAEKAIRSKKVLIVDSDKKQQLVARMALGGTGVALSVASQLEEAENLLRENQYDLLMCESGLASVLELAHKMHFKGELVFLASGEIQSYLEKMKSMPYLGHVISRENDDRSFTVKHILTTVTKILNEDYFGLEKYLAWGVDTNEIQVFESSRRKEFIEKMKSDLGQIGVRGTLLDRCHTVSEEMLMNAIYDAPSSADGKALFNHLPRTVEVQLNQDQAARLRYACDGNLIGISVTDPFGGLTKETIIAYLDSCYRGEAGILNAEKGGAGRGLHQIIESSDLTIFNVKSRIKTEVIALFFVDKSAKKNSRRPAFHYFFS